LRLSHGSHHQQRWFMVAKHTNPKKGSAHQRGGGYAQLEAFGRYCFCGHQYIDGKGLHQTPGAHTPDCDALNAGLQAERQRRL
jgi:hypothetical protein